jgi:hypothetical protein
MKVQSDVEILLSYGPILVVVTLGLSQFFETDKVKNFVQLVLSVPAVTVCVIVFIAMRKDGLSLLLGVPTTDNEVRSYPVIRT